MKLEDWWNEFNGGNSKYSERNLIQCHFVYNTSRRTSLEWNPALCGERPATNRPSHAAACSMGVGDSVPGGKATGL
jgi:hypothetical protein